MLSRCPADIQVWGVGWIWVLRPLCVTPSPVRLLILAHKRFLCEPPSTRLVSLPRNSADFCGALRNVRRSVDTYHQRSETMKDTTHVRPHPVSPSAVCCDPGPLSPRPASPSDLQIEAYIHQGASPHGLLSSCIRSSML